MGGRAGGVSNPIESVQLFQQFYKSEEGGGGIEDGKRIPGAAATGTRSAATGTKAAATGTKAAETSEGATGGREDKEMGKRRRQCGWGACSEYEREKQEFGLVISSDITPYR